MSNRVRAVFVTITASVGLISGVIGLCVLLSVAVRAESGIASHYSGYAKTANGERFDPGSMTAAHKTLPFGARVRVTSKRTGKSIVVRINNRGPFVKGRVIDLTPAAARALGFSGLLPVTLTRL